MLSQLGYAELTVPGSYSEKRRAPAPSEAICSFNKTLSQLRFTLPFRVGMLGSSGEVEAFVVEESSLLPPPLVARE